MVTGTRVARRGRRVHSYHSLPLAAIAAILVGCAGGDRPSPTPRSTATVTPVGSVLANEPSPAAPPSGSIVLYTSVTADTVDAVVNAYRVAQPGVTVEVFRAPTGELAGRIAADLRTGRIAGDVLWLTDPLSIQAYDEQGLLRTWEPAAAAEVPEAYRASTYWGSRFLNVVMIRGSDVTPSPAGWSDLADPAYRDAVGIPDPAFAGSAFGALGYFAETAAFGLDFYRSLMDNGAVQVKTPDEVTTGVAEGRFKVGMTIDYSARTAIGKGSPIELVWPSDGAIALYSPIAVVGATAEAAAAESFVEFVLDDGGQKAIAKTGWQPIRATAGGPELGGTQVYPNWSAAFGRQTELLDEYRAIFGG